jgi:hypothetical protein
MLMRFLTIKAFSSPNRVEHMSMMPQPFQEQSCMFLRRVVKKAAGNFPNGVAGLGKSELVPTVIYSTFPQS